jgi:hypothetical protein
MDEADRENLMNTFKILVMLLMLVGTANAERLSILTLNVAGLPDPLTKQNYPVDRMYQIAVRSDKWDIVAYQEDFYYSMYLDKYSHFSSTVRGTQWHGWSYVWPWLGKSGLTIKSNLVVEKPNFLAYSECFGYFNYGSDCWVPKGVLCQRMITPGGVLIDLCTTHLDAGDDPGSVLARRNQLKKYLKYLPPPALDTPWVLIETGDYNLRSCEEDINPVIKGKEVVVCDTTGRNGVDYITATTNKYIVVEVIEGGVSPMFDGLSDHRALGVILDLDY